MFHKRRERFKFTEKRHSKKGIITMFAAIVLLMIWGLFLIFSYRTAGMLSMYYGSAGVLALIMSVLNFIFSVQSLFEENSFQLFPRVAVILSFLALTGWAATYVFGFLF